MSSQAGPLQAAQAVASSALSPANRLNCNQDIMNGINGHSMLDGAGGMLSHRTHLRYQ